MADYERLQAMAGAAGNSSASRFADRKPFDPEEGGPPDTAAKSGTGYPGPEVPPGRKFDPEGGGPPDTAAKSGTGYPGPEVPPGRKFDPEEAGPSDTAARSGTDYPGPEAPPSHGNSGPDGE